jgi:drug/metabolite transporter (DMT)-like permease
MGLCLILWSTAVLETRVANASLLANSAPIFVALYAWLVLRTRLNRTYWIGLLLAMAGTVVVIGMDLILAPSLNQGNLLALGSALFYAAYYLLVERCRQTTSTLVTIWWIDLSSTLVLVVYCLAAGLPLFGYPAGTWLTFFLNALIPQVIGYFALTYALGHLPAWIVSPIMILQPVLTALLAIPLMGEPLNWTQIVGGLAVIAGIYLINRVKNTDNPH